MKVLLLDVDGKLPNIALHKLAIWHEGQGDEVTWNMPLFLNQADKVYISTILTKSRPKVENLVGLRPDAVVGGTGTWGWFIDPPPNFLPCLPAEVELVKARINYGFTTRGCIRHCPFCLIPLVEGNIRAVGDIFDVWDGKSKTLTLFDNNILALPEHFERIVTQLVAEELVVDFNQGLDIRLVTSGIARMLSRLKTKDIRFAFDSLSLESVFRRKIDILRSNGFPNKYFFVYVLVGFDTTFEEDMYRLDVLKELKCRPYVMRHERTPNERRYNEMASWANQLWTFAEYNFSEYWKFRTGTNL